MKIKDLPKVRKRIHRTCSLCGKDIKVIVYSKSNYRGGHFFGRIPDYTVSMGVRGEVKLKLNRKKSFEYWECPKCYWP